MMHKSPIAPFGNDAYRVGLSRGHFAIISARDLDLVASFVWRASHPSRSGKIYANRTVHEGPRAQRVSRVIGMHRLVLGAQLGQIVDHINGNSLDNRRENLRITDYRGNAQNRGLHRNNTSGFKGVTLCHGKWAAQIKVDRRNRGLGAYETPEAAARAYDAAARTHFGEFASLNFPEAVAC